MHYNVIMLLDIILNIIHIFYLRAFGACTTGSNASNTLRNSYINTLPNIRASFRRYIAT